MNEFIREKNWTCTQVYEISYCATLLPTQICRPSGTISNLQTYILPNLNRKPSIYQPFILPNLHFAKPSNYQISNLQTYILPNLHRKTFNLPILHFTKPTFSVAKQLQRQRCPSVYLSVCASISNTLSSINFNHQTTLITNRL